MKRFTVHESEKAQFIADYLKRNYWMAVDYVAHDGAVVYVGFKFKVKS